MGWKEQLLRTIKGVQGLTNLYTKLSKPTTKKAAKGIGNLTGNLSRLLLNELPNITLSIDTSALPKDRLVEICILLKLGSHLSKQRSITYFQQKEIARIGLDEKKEPSLTERRKAMINAIRHYIVSVKKHANEGDLISKMVHQCLNRDVSFFLYPPWGFGNHRFPYRSFRIYQETSPSK